MYTLPEYMIISSQITQEAMQRVRLTPNSETLRAGLNMSNTKGLKTEQIKNIDFLTVLIVFLLVLTIVNDKIDLGDSSRMIVRKVKLEPWYTDKQF